MTLNCTKIARMVNVYHIVLRFALAHEGHIPRWRYDTFLDYAAEAGILRKVGGGYIFRHRMLLEYFAEQYQEKLKLSDTGAKDSASSPVQAAKS